jgi:predicted Ser/Thr protein kinase
VTPGARVGPYVLVRELGRGGMGVVFAAQHADLRRPVALKVRLARPGDERGARRFLVEGQAAARVRHPNVVPVHEVGESDGRQWLAMDLVEGQPLDERVARGGPLEPRAAAGLVATVARALEAAHREGVLHRDLKPANVLLRASDGAPLVTDFGLAKLVEGAESLTRTGELLGTPGYLAPEQVTGAPPDARVDVWALGATLHFLLTGHPPFEGPTLQAVAAMLRTDAVAPSVTRPGLPAALDQVVLRCLQRDRARRYPSAAAVADELERFGRGEATEAERRAAASTRRRAGAAITLVAGAALGASLLVRRPEPAPPAPVPATPAPAASATPSAPVLAPPADAPLDDGPSRPATWSRATAEGPAARWGHAMAWDGQARRVMLFGGRDAAATFDDLWSWDGARWRREHVDPHPEARYGHVLVWDPDRKRVVLHGGAAVGQEATPFPDVWELDDERWKLRPCPGPTPRLWHGAAHDPVGRRTLVFGGGDQERTFGDLWSWDGASWTSLDRPGTPPAPRRLPSLAWDARNQALLLYEVSTEGDEVWTWTATDGWRRVEPARLEPGPGLRLEPRLVTTPAGVILHGGVVIDGVRGRPRDDSWRWTGAGWEPLQRLGVPRVAPRPRRFEALTYDPVRRRVVLFGGQSTEGAGLDDTWLLTLPD